MSWDATLICDKCGHAESWNYTGNTTPMVETALDNYGVPPREKNFHARLHGMTAEEGAKWLALVVAAMQDEPVKRRKMNPTNGWGDYDSLLSVLLRMREATAANPDAVWRSD